MFHAKKTKAVEWWKKVIRRRKKRKRKEREKKCCCHYHTTGEFIGVGDILLKMKFSFHTPLFIHFFSPMWFTVGIVFETLILNHELTKFANNPHSLSKTRFFFFLICFIFLFLCSNYFALILNPILKKNHIKNVSARK